MNVQHTPTSLPRMVERDAWLRPAAPEIIARGERFRNRLNNIRKWSRSLSNYANAHLYFGIHYDPVRHGWWFREWLPGAKAPGSFSLQFSPASLTNRLDSLISPCSSELTLETQASFQTTYIVPSFLLFPFSNIPVKNLAQPCWRALIS